MQQKIEYSEYNEDLTYTVPRRQGLNILGFSLHQPWATLIAQSRKQIETRDWSTDYRGWVAIHAAKYTSAEYKELSEEWPFNKYIVYNDLPYGKIVAVAFLHSIQSTITCKAALRRSDQEEELAFGNYEPGRYAWLMKWIKPVEPIECKGNRKFWHIPDAAYNQLLEQVGNWPENAPLVA